MMKPFFIFLFLFFGLYCPEVLSVPAHRIVTLAPNLAEVVLASGAAKYLVGVSVATNRTKALQSLPVVASSSGIDFEKLIALKPGLVIAWKGGNPVSLSQKLKNFHIPVYWADFHDISDVARVAIDIGKLAGTEWQAQMFAKQFLKDLQSLRKQYEHKPKVKVFYELSTQPLMTLNRRTSVGQIIELCGGENIFYDTINVAPEINIESVLKANPQMILVSEQSISRHQLYNFWKRYPSIDAVKNKRIYWVHSDEVERYSPQILSGARSVCRLIDSVRKSS